MRRERIRQWVVAVIICGLIFGVGKYVDYLATKPPEPEKQVITVNAPADMETAFNDALQVADMDDTHKIVMTNMINANICVEYARQNDESYQKIAYTPFVVAYNTSSEHQKKLKKAEVFVESPYDDDYLEVDVLKIINEAIGEGKWANFGLKDEKELKVFYPSKDSVYWNDFFDFLLVTVNDGTYPKTAAEKEAAEEIIEQFLDSEYTEGVTDFYEQVERTGGFPTSAIYILTEKDALDIGKSANIYYPINTVYFNYYVKGDEIGKQLIDVFDEVEDGFFLDNNFYYRIASKHYRSVKCSKLENYKDNVYYERDVYNVAKIPENVEFTTEPIEVAEPTEETTAPTEITTSTEATTPTSE